MPHRFNILIDTIIPTPNTNNGYMCTGTIHGIPMKIYLKSTEDNNNANIDIYTITQNTQPIWDQHNTYSTKNVSQDWEILQAQIAPTTYQHLISHANDLHAFNQCINTTLDTLSDPIYRQRSEALIHALLFLLSDETYIEDAIAWISSDHIKQWYRPGTLHYTTKDKKWINIPPIHNIFIHNISSQLIAYNNKQHTISPVTQINTQLISHALQYNPIVTHPCPTDYVSAIAAIKALDIPYIPECIKSANIKHPPTVIPKDRHIKDICDTNNPVHRTNAHIPLNQPFSFTMDTPPTNPTAYRDRPSHHGYLYNTPIFIRYRPNNDKTQAIIYAKQWRTLPYWNEHHVYQQNIHETIHAMIASIPLPITFEQINNSNDIAQVLAKKANEYTKKHMPHRANILQQIIYHHIATLYSPDEDIELYQQDNTLFIVDKDTKDCHGDDDPIPVHEIFNQCDALEHWIQLPALIPTLLNKDNQYTQWEIIDLENIIHQQNEHDGQPLSQHAYLSLLRQAQQEHIPQLPDITPKTVIIKNDD